MMKYKIGDRVRIYATNLTGSVTDVLHSETSGEIRYLVDLDGSDSFSGRRSDSVSGRFPERSSGN